MSVGRRLAQIGVLGWIIVVPMLGGLFMLRFLFQKTPRMQLRPYLHLPVDQRHLVAFFEAGTVLSVHNLFPLLFAVPYAARHLAPTFGASAAASAAARAATSASARALAAHISCGS